MCVCVSVFFDSDLVCLRGARCLFISVLGVSSCLRRHVAVLLRMWQICLFGVVLALSGLVLSGVG